jgi:hypothetical protein
MIDYEDDAEVYDNGLLGLEQKADLERIRARGARVEVDLAEDTSLRRYVQSRRARSIEALQALVFVEPENALAVAGFQHIVAEYLNVREWARGEIEASVMADNQILGEHRGETDD